MNGYFEGLYFKHQARDFTISIIPSFHKDSSSKKTGTLQIITDKDVYIIENQPVHFDKKRMVMGIGKSTFTLHGCHINCLAKGVTIKGGFSYTTLNPLKSSIMGPFRFIPFLPCQHSVFSIRHKVNGKLQIGRDSYRIINGIGYIEGDKGCSFPEHYFWTQCNHKGLSIMMAVADLKCMGKKFTGCTGFIYRNGVEFRMATYCGARVIYNSADRVVIKQGEYYLNIRMDHKSGKDVSLRAPAGGTMGRLIDEALSIPVTYRLTRNGRELFCITAANASAEYNW